MSLYVDDPTVDELILTIINDGNGEQCGMTYRARCEAAKRPDGGLLLYRGAARHYNRHASRVYGTRHATLAQCSAAGDYLARYYAEHLAEMA